MSQENVIGYIAALSVFPPSYYKISWLLNSP